MTKLSIFDLCIVSNYIYTRNDYVNIMCVNTKFKKLNKYFNQFKANPPFDESTNEDANMTSNKTVNKLFTEKYKPYKHKFDFICVKDDKITTTPNEKIRYNYVYFNNYTSKFNKHIYTNELFISKETMDVTKKMSCGMVPRLHANICYFDKNITCISKSLTRCAYINTIDLENCTKLTKINNFSLTSFGLKNIHLPSSIKLLGNGAFEGINIENIKLPIGLTGIYYAAFSRNHYLTELEIPNTVSWVFTYAIIDCYNLKRLVGPKNIIDMMDLGYLKIPRIEYN